MLLTGPAPWVQSGRATWYTIGGGATIVGCWRSRNFLKKKPSRMATVKSYSFFYFSKKMLNNIYF